MTMGITYMKQLQEEHHAMFFHAAEAWQKDCIYW